MKKSLVFVYGALIVLTLLTAVLSNAMAVSPLAIVLIMGFSVVKFLLVSFEFMELKKANPFWKVSLVAVLGLIVFSLVFF